MTRIQTLLLIVICCFLLRNVHAQHKMPLSIGDQLPNIELRNIKNYLENRLFIDNLKDKAILFDFGTTSCAPCMKALSTLDSMQRLFNKDLQIFMVTPEKTETVAAYLEKNKKAARLSIPIITEDTLLSKYFRYRSIPHQVWIDKDKVVKAFTDHHYLTRPNIDSLIKGVNLDWPVKWDFAYDHRQPLMVLNNANLSPKSYPDAILRQSFFSKNMAGIKPGFSEVVDSSNKVVRISMINMSVVEMYLRLYNRIWNFVFPPSQVALNVKEPHRIYFDPEFGYKALWRKNNTYCYEATFPIDVPKEIRTKRMLTELNDYLALKVSLEKHEVTCWVLKLQGGSPSENSKVHLTGPAISLSVNGFVYQMNRTYQNPPLIDETGLAGESRTKLEMTLLSGSFKDFEALNRQLSSYGLVLEKAKRDIEVCVFTDQSL